MTVSAPQTTRLRQRRFVAAGLILLAFPVLLALALLVRVGAFVPLGAALAVVVLASAAAEPRFGLVATASASMLLPTPLAFHVAGVTLTVGRVVGWAFLIGWLAALSRRDGPRFRRTSLDVAFVAVVFSFALSLTANSPQLGRTALNEAINATTLFVVDYIVFFYAAVSVMGAGRRHLEYVVRTVVLVVAVIGVLGVVEWLTGRNVFTFVGGVFPSGFRRQFVAIAEAAAREQHRGSLHRTMGTFDGPNPFGAAMVMALPLLIHLWTTATSRRWLYGTAALVCTVSSMLTISRSAFIGLVVVLGVYGVASGRVSVTRRNVAAIVVVLTTVVASSPALRSTVSFYFRDLTGQRATVTGRLKDYDNVLRQFDRTPVAGSGPATWSRKALERPDNGKVEPTDRGQVVLDNSYLGSIAERGAVGLLAVIAVFLGAIAVAIRSLRGARSSSERSLRAALLASIMLFALLSAFFDMLSFAGVTKLYLLLVAAMLVDAGACRGVPRPVWRHPVNGSG